MLRGPRSTRRIATISAGIHIVSLLGVYYHLAIADHGYCSEHGELVHVDHGDSRPATKGTQPTVERSVHLAGIHNCIQLDLLVQLATALGVGPLAVGSAPAAVDCPSRREPLAQPSIPLLRQSPKLSPPLT